MTLTPQQMDQKMDEHFAFEGRDDVEGVLATLTDDVEHDIVGWPIGPSQGREGARKFYETLFVDLSDSKVRCVKRLYGHNFMVDESSGAARRRASRSAWRAAIAPSNSGCCTWSSLRTAATSSARTSGSISLPSCSNCRRTDVTATEKIGRPNQKTRTRKDLLQAASRLMKQGRAPYSGGGRRGGAGLARNGVSLLSERRSAPGRSRRWISPCPSPESSSGASLSRDPVVRLQRVETALYDMILANEPLLRTMLAHTIQQGTQADENGKLPRRQNRRTPLIEAALEPARDQFKPGGSKDADEGPGADHGDGGHHRREGRPAAR